MYEVMIEYNQDKYTFKYARNIYDLARILYDLFNDGVELEQVTINEIVEEECVCRK